MGNTKINSRKSPSTEGKQLTDTRFCKNCRWSRETNEQPVYWKCVSPRNAIKRSVDPLTGTQEDRLVFIYCKTLRELAAEDTCSPDGQWYEPK
jgi:hypothetical protein